MRMEMVAVIVMCRDLLLMAYLPQILQGGRREQWLEAAPNLSPAGIKQSSRSSQSVYLLSLPILYNIIFLFLSMRSGSFLSETGSDDFSLLLYPSLQARQPC